IRDPAQYAARLQGVDGHAPIQSGTTDIPLRPKYEGHSGFPPMRRTRRARESGSMLVSAQLPVLTDVPLPIALAILALLDGLSVGTLLIPLFFLIAPGRPKVARILLYL